MGNVPLLQSGEGGGGTLTPFQRSKVFFEFGFSLFLPVSTCFTCKVIFDFEKFFDLNKDGILTYKDFLWAKDRICQMSGWKVLHEMKKCGAINLFGRYR